MFPLGSTVFPSQVVPLHIYEERYRQLMTDLTGPDGEGTFAIVLIDRGQEVGASDTGVLVATRVEILQSEEFDDGRWGVVTAGVERVTIHEWLEVDPYPRALVSSRPVVDDGGGSLADLQVLLIETLTEAAAQAGAELPEDLGFSQDPHQLLDQLSAVSPLIEFDRQQVLEAQTTSGQMAKLRDALEGKLVLLRAMKDE